VETGARSAAPEGDGGLLGLERKHSLSDLSWEMKEFASMMNSDQKEIAKQMFSHEGAKAQKKRRYRNNLSDIPC
jgi:hypothetical protein